MLVRFVLKAGQHIVAPGMFPNPSVNTSKEDEEIMKTIAQKSPILMAAVAMTASLFMAAAAQAQPVMKDGVLADAAGRTVYTFDKDEANKSNCAGGCLVKWPAFVAKPEAKAQGEFGVIEANGVRQWTYNSQPLYYFVGDVKPGDRTGDGMGGVWHVVGEKSAANASSSYKY